VAQAVEFLRPAGVDVSTGVESAPGLKDPLLMRDFITNARRAHAETAKRDPVDTNDAEEPYDWREA
jgi:phosphoribosylanthranilate isomerase